MTAAVPEKDLAQALKDALTPAGVLVRWGWAALETAEGLPSLPLVTITRTLANAVGYADMCDMAEPTVDTTVQIHSWAELYEDARALAAQARGIVLAAGGWALQTEVDNFDGAFRAWCITAEFLGAGMQID